MSIRISSDDITMPLTLVEDDDFGDFYRCDVCGVKATVDYDFSPPQPEHSLTECLKQILKIVSQSS